MQLALIEKAKRVFAAGDAGVMLSFPLLSPMGFTAAESGGAHRAGDTRRLRGGGGLCPDGQFHLRRPTMVATATDRMLRMSSTTCSAGPRWGRRDGRG